LCCVVLCTAVFCVAECCVAFCDSDGDLSAVNPLSPLVFCYVLLSSVMIMMMMTDGLLLILFPFSFNRVVLRDDDGDCSAADTSLYSPDLYHVLYYLALFTV
jgi:hypothetical protein